MNRKKRHEGGMEGKRENEIIKSKTFTGDTERQKQT